MIKLVVINAGCYNNPGSELEFFAQGRGNGVRARILKFRLKQFISPEKEPGAKRIDLNSSP